MGSRSQPSASGLDLVVIGGGVLGAFHAFHAAEAGLRVTLVDRDCVPRGASVQNFGMIIPDAMPPGEWRRRSVESAAIYRRLRQAFPFHLTEGGTQYVPMTELEAVVARELAAIAPGHGDRVEWLDPVASRAANPLIRPEAAEYGSVVGRDDLKIDPAAFMAALLDWMPVALGVLTYRGLPAVELRVGGPAESVWPTTLVWKHDESSSVPARKPVCCWPTV